VNHCGQCRRGLVAMRGRIFSGFLDPTLDSASLAFARASALINRCPRWLDRPADLIENPR